MITPPFPAEFLTKDLDRGLDLFSDAILHANFPQAEVDKLLAQSVDGVKAAKDQAEAVIFNYYNGYLYGTHPYARPGRRRTFAEENSARGHS